MRDTIDMAREAGAIHIHEKPKEFALVGNDSIKAFEALVRADERDRAMRENAYVQAEREACAKTKAGKPRELKAVGRGTLLDEQQFCFDKGWREGAAAVRAAIRARGETK
jgi:hypothetical protein